MPFGGAIKLQGESEYIRALTQINSKLKETSADMKLVSASFASGDRSTQAVAQKAEVLNKKLEEQKQKLSLLKTEYSKMQGEVDQQKDNHEKLVQEYKKEEQELERLGRELGKDSKEYQDQQKKVDALAKEVDKSTKADIANEKALSKMRAEITKTEADIKKTTREIDNLGKETEETAKETQEAGDGFTVMKGILSNLATQGIQKIIDGLKKMAKAAYEAWKEFDEGVDIIYAKTGLVGDAGDGLIDVYGRIAGKVPQDLDEVGTAVGEVSTRFDLQGKELEDVTTQLLKYAKVNNTDVNGSIDSVQSMMAAWNIKTKDAGRVLNVLTAVSQKTGIQVDKLSDLMTTNAAALMEMGLSYEEAALFAGQFSKSGLDTNQALMGMKKALQAATKEGKPLNQYLAEAERKIKGAKSETEALSIATSVFGSKAGPNMAKAIRNGNVTFKEMQGALKGVDGALDKTFDAMLSFPDKVKMTSNSVKSLVGEMVQSIADGSLSQFVQYDLPAKMDEIMPQVNTLISDICETISGSTGSFADALTTVINKALTEVDTVTVGKTLAEVIAKSSSSAGVSLDVEEIAKNLFGGLWEGVMQYAETDLGKYEISQDVVNKLFTKILGKGSPLAIPFTLGDYIVSNKDSDIMSNLLEKMGYDPERELNTFDVGMRALWAVPYENARESIEAIQGYLTESWNRVVAGWDAFAALFTGKENELLTAIEEQILLFIADLLGLGDEAGQAFVDGIMGKKGDSEKSGKEVAKAAGKGLKSQEKGAKNEGATTGANYASGVSSKKGAAASAASGVSKETVANLRIAANTAHSIGADVSNGIAQGIADNAHKIYELAQTIATNIEEKFKKVLEVNSPSKLMAREVGAPIAEGIAYGFENEMHDVTTQMADAIPKTFDIDTGVNVSTRRARQEASMVKAFKAALSDVKIILNNKVAGQFVETTVSRLIYS